MKRELNETHKDRWDRGFSVLCKFRKRKGHCCPPLDHRESKYNLGRWVVTQRYLKDGLSVERKRRLDRIGFVWNWRDFAWERSFEALLKFKRREGHCRVPIQHREGNFNLGSWVSVQRRERNKMIAKRRAKLDKIGFMWKAYGQK
jgi:Helicase associated domain